VAAAGRREGPGLCALLAYRQRSGSLDGDCKPFFFIVRRKGAAVRCTTSATIRKTRRTWRTTRREKSRNDETHAEQH